MKKYTQLTVANLRRNHSAIPAPFPGKFPTRIAWVVVRHVGGRQVEEKYLGKPSVNAINRLLSVGRKPDVVMTWLKEFDKKTTVGERSWQRPLQRVDFSATSTQLVRYYHLLWLPDWVPGARGKFGSHKIAGHWIYATVPPSLAEIDHHTRWVRAAGFSQP